METFKHPERKRLTRLRLTPQAIRQYRDYAQARIEDNAGKGTLDKNDPHRIMINLAACVLDLAEDLVAARADRERMDLQLAKVEVALHDLYYAVHPPEEVP